MNLSRHIKIIDFVTTGNYASGTASRNGDSVDMSGWDGLLFICPMAAIAGSAVGDIHLETSINDSDFTDLEGTKVAIADDDDDQIFVIDLYRPLERYIRGVITKNGANAQAECPCYIQYTGRKLPVSNMGADQYELHTSPARGTK